MKKIDLVKDVITNINKSIDGAFVVIGEIGTRMYYYHNKKEAETKYLLEAKTRRQRC